MQGTAGTGAGFTQGQKAAAALAAAGIGYYFYSQRQEGARRLSKASLAAPAATVSHTPARAFQPCLLPSSPTLVVLQPGKNVGDAASRAGAAAGRQSLKVHAWILL